MEAMGGIWGSMGTLLSPPPSASSPLLPGCPAPHPHSSGRVFPALGQQWGGRSLGPTSPNPTKWGTGVPKSHQRAPNGPKMVLNGSRMNKMAPKWPQMEPDCPQMDPKAPIGSPCPQTLLKGTPDVPKMSSWGLQRIPKAPPTVPMSPKCPIGSPNSPKMSP